MSKNATLNNTSSSDATETRQIVEKLTQLIQADGLSVGDRLPSIRELAAKLNISANRVRDAMVQAQAMGLIKLRARSGAFVQSLTCAPLVDVFVGALASNLVQQDHNLIYLLDARRIVELETTTQAAQRRRLEDLLPMRNALEAMNRLPNPEQRAEYVEADIAFHVGVAETAGNPVLVGIVRSLLDCLRPYLLNLPWSQERRLSTEQSHRDIYDAILRGNVEAARAALQGHLGMAKESLLLEVQAPFRTG